MYAISAPIINGCIVAIIPLSLSFKSSAWDAIRYTIILEAITKKA